MKGTFSTYFSIYFLQGYVPVEMKLDKTNYPDMMKKHTMWR